MENVSMISIEQDLTPLIHILKQQRKTWLEYTNTGILSAQDLHNALNKRTYLSSEYLSTLTYTELYQLQTLADQHIWKKHAIHANCLDKLCDVFISTKAAFINLASGVERIISDQMIQYNSCKLKSDHGTLRDTPTKSVHSVSNKTLIQLINIQDHIDVYRKELLDALEQSIVHLIQTFLCAIRRVPYVSDVSTPKPSLDPPSYPPSYPASKHTSEYTLIQGLFYSLQTILGIQVAHSQQIPKRIKEIYRFEQSKQESCCLLQCFSSLIQDETAIVAAANIDQLTHFMNGITAPLYVDLNRWTEIITTVSLYIDELHQILHGASRIQNLRDSANSTLNINQRMTSPSSHNNSPKFHHQSPSGNKSPTKKNVTTTPSSSKSKKSSKKNKKR